MSSESEQKSQVPSMIPVVGMILCLLAIAMIYFKLTGSVL